MPELRAERGNAARALEFTILTIARTTETTDALWTEIDFANRTWTVPAERMKADEPHVVPLCAQSLHILREMQKRDPVPLKRQCGKKTNVFGNALFISGRKGFEHCVVFPLDL